MEADLKTQDHNQTILVVDDDPLVLKFLSDLLHRSHYNLLSAASGAQAMEKALDYKGEIDLLLSDFDMPGMGGIELASQLTASRPKVKILLMSGFHDGMLVLNEGWHFLPKPFIPSQLRALISGLITPH